MVGAIEKCVCIALLLALVSFVSCQGSKHDTADDAAKVDPGEPKPEPKYCEADGDCLLFRCIGCVNKIWAKTAPEEPPCETFAGYSGCKCITNICIEVK